MLREESYSMDDPRASAENMLSSPHFGDDDIMQSRSSSRASDGQNSNYREKVLVPIPLHLLGKILKRQSAKAPLSGTSFDYGSVVDGTGRRLTTTPTHNFEENSSDGRRSFSNNGSDAMPGYIRKVMSICKDSPLQVVLGKAAPSAVFQGMRQWSSQNPLLSKFVVLLTICILGGAVFAAAFIHSATTCGRLPRIHTKQRIDI